MEGGEEEGRTKLAPHIISLSRPRAALPSGRTLAILRATRYLVPSFSSSAMTQSLMQGMHSAYRQSIMP